MKLYRVYRQYGENVLLDVVWAKDEDDVYKKMDWTQKDNPQLIIEEMTRREGVILAHHIADGLLIEQIKRR